MKDQIWHSSCTCGCGSTVARRDPPPRSLPYSSMTKLFEDNAPPSTRANALTSTQLYCSRVLAWLPHADEYEGGCLSAYSKRGHPCGSHLEHLQARSVAWALRATRQDIRQVWLFKDRIRCAVLDLSSISPPDDVERSHCKND